jgi:hypothetical protein
MNLWADFENQQAGNLAETARPRSTRRLTEQVVLSSLRDWLLRDYVTSYCRSLRGMSLYRRCYWIDALGYDTHQASSQQQITQPTSLSKARIKVNNETQELPPILQPLAALSQTLLAECPTHPLALHGILLAAEHKGKATPVTDKVVLPKESGIVALSWSSMASQILNSIEQSPAIYLLNPFGHMLYSLDLLAPIYRRTTAPTELCLLIPHKQAESHVLTASRAPDAASTLTELLHSDRWKTFPTQEPDASTTKSANSSSAERLIDLLATSIRKHFSFVQPIALTMPVRPSLVETVPYTLLFATRRKESLLSMNDAVCLQRRRVEEESYRGLLGETWFAAQQQQRLTEEMRQLYQEILRRGRGGRIRRWPDLRLQLLLAHFGQFSVVEYNTTLLQLLRDRVVRCQWRQKREISEKKTSLFETIPGNDDVLLWE